MKCCSHAFLPQYSRSNFNRRRTSQDGAAEQTEKRSNNQSDSSSNPETIISSRSSTTTNRLDYEHGFHAGNFADVFKHVLLILVIQHMLKKAKPMAYVETHSGAGLYSLTRTILDGKEGLAEAAFEQEFQRGIGKLWQRSSSSNVDRNAIINNKNKDAIGTYLDIVESCQLENDSAQQLLYPGSPLFATSLLLGLFSNNETKLIQGHSLLLYEKADLQYQRLQQHLGVFLAGNSNNETNATVSTDIRCENGYSGLSQYASSSSSSLNATSTSRALVFIDPPYQYGSDTEQIVALCRDLSYHWRSARIIIWHPVRQDHADKLNRLYRLLRDAIPAEKDILSVEVYPPPLSPLRPTGTTIGKQKQDVGTGMIMIQPPFGIDHDCRNILSRLYNDLLQQPPASNDDDMELQRQDQNPSIRIEWL